MNSVSPPFYLKFSLILISISLLAAIIFLGRAIVIPLGFSILLASLLLPVTNALHRWGLNRVVAILLTLVLSVLIIAGIVYFLSSQIGNFLEDLPLLKKRLHEVTGMIHSWVRDHLNIPVREQKEYLDETTKKMNQDGPDLVQQTVLTLKEFISYVIFLPVFTFLLLYHKEMIKRFFIQLFARSEKDRVVDVLHESQGTAQQYVRGLLMQLLIVFALNSTGFLIGGIKYPIFLAMVSAMLNIVPYIGMLIANLFCSMVTLISSENYSDVFIVFGVLMGVQVIDNNILMPLIVGSRLRLNALVIILGVLIGGSLCGVPGMFLAIPALALTKVVFERVDDLKPWAMLLGDETTARLEPQNALKNLFTRIRNRPAPDRKEAASTKGRRENGS